MRFNPILSLVLMFALSWPLAATSQALASAESELVSARRMLDSGEFERAAVAAQDVLNRAALDYATRLKAHLTFGEARLASGRAADVSSGLDAAETAARRSDDRRGLARVLLLQGTADYRAGKGEASQRKLEEARTLAAELGDGGQETRAMLNLALTMIPDRIPQAQELLTQVIARAGSAKDPEPAAVAGMNLARLKYTASARVEVLPLLQDAIEAAGRMHESYRQAQLLSGAGELALSMQRDTALDSGLRQSLREVAERALGNADAIAQKLGDSRSRSFAQGYLAESALLAGDTNRALALNQQAILFAYRANASDALYRWYWQRGRMIARGGGDDEAIDAYRRAVRYLADVRPGVDASAASIGLGFRQVAGPLYLELADLLLRQSAAAGEGDRRRVLLLEAREVIESSKAAELQDYFQDGCVAAQRDRVAGLDQISARTAVLYPVLLPDRVELLLSIGGEITQVTVDASAGQVVDAVRAMRDGLENILTRRYLGPSRKLYDLLIGPLEPQLQRGRVETIVVVPDGPLRTIPLAALHDGKGFLIERYAFAVTPGLTLTDPRPFPKTRMRVLLNGLTQAVQGFSPLPSVAREIDLIRTLYTAEVLQDTTFLVSRLETQLSQYPYSLVHIASHGQFDSNPKNTFLLTFDGKVGMDLLEKMIAPTRSRERALELLTLSACQTAAGDDRAALGLAGVAIKAGARSALASLWFINDESSATLVGEFYRELQAPGATKASALQAAQRILIADRRFSHPAYWAPFLLIGNWL